MQCPPHPHRGRKWETELAPKQTFSPGDHDRLLPSCVRKRTRELPTGVRRGRTPHTYIAVAKTTPTGHAHKERQSLSNKLLEHTNQHDATRVEQRYNGAKKKKKKRPRRQRIIQTQNLRTRRLFPHPKIPFHAKRTTSACNPASMEEATTRARRERVHINKTQSTNANKEESHNSADAAGGGVAFSRMKSTMESLSLEPPYGMGFDLSPA